MNELSNLFSVVNVAITLLVLVGGYMAIKSANHRQSGEIQSQAIDALKAELEVLQRRLEALERENTRLQQIMSLIKSALRKRGLTISIDGDLVTIDDGKGHRSQHSRIQED